MVDLTIFQHAIINLLGLLYLYFYRCHVNLFHLLSLGIKHVYTIHVLSVYSTNFTVFCTHSHLIIMNPNFFSVILLKCLIISYQKIYFSVMDSFFVTARVIY